MINTEIKTLLAGTSWVISAICLLTLFFNLMNADTPRGSFLTGGGIFFVTVGLCFSVINALAWSAEMD